MDSHYETVMKKRVEAKMAEDMACGWQPEEGMIPNTGRVDYRPFNVNILL
jgi:hypothetical protein